MSWRKFSPQDVQGMTDRLSICTRPEDHDQAFAGTSDRELCEFAGAALHAAADLIERNERGETRRLNVAYRISGAGRIALEVFARRLKAREEPH